jgi:hypothetical protein
VMVTKNRQRRGIIPQRQARHSWLRSLACLYMHERSKDIGSRNVVVESMTDAVEMPDGK